MARKLIAKLLMCASVAVAGAAAQADHAVVVGVNTYPYVEDSDLKKARSDALLYRDFLLSHMGLEPSEITLLLDRDATRTSVIAAIQQDLIAGTKPGDNVYFYFSGHGSRINDAGSDETTDGKDEMIILSNAGSSEFGAILDDEIGILFESITDRRVMIVVDACHSGTISRSSSADSEQDRARFLPADLVVPQGLPPALITRADTATADDARVNTRAFVPGQRHMSVWSAASQNQLAFENQRGGIFTRAFIEGVGRKRADFNSNGQVSNSELLRYARATSANFCRGSRSCQERNSGHLTPEFSGRIEDNIVLAAVNQSEELDTSDFQQQQQPVQEQAITETSTTTDTIVDGLTNTTPQQTPVLNAPGALTDLFTPQNTAGLTLRIAPSPQLRLGEPVAFEVTSQSDGHLMVFDYNPKGELFQIYPSFLSADAVMKITANRRYEIPQGVSRNGKPLQITVSEPAGSGHLLAVLVQDPPGAVLSALPPTLNETPVPNAGGILTALAERLNRGTNVGGVSRPLNWSSVVLPYTISK